ncbi:MAG TPA: hypothetical protein VNL18_00635 [Gemmatimonadales bacterium]|nr:hypothetical protein [Gemmatimonadales bacterium]
MSNRSRWWVAVALLTTVTAAAQVAAPSIAGISLGMTAEQTRGAVGRADRESESLGMRFWEYSRRGVTVIWKEGEAGVHGIVASRPAAGQVSGVKIGDPEVELRNTWGTPARERQSGRFLDFIGAGWVLSAELRDGKVVQITLMAAGAASH